MLSAVEMRGDLVQKLANFTFFFFSFLENCSAFQMVRTHLWLNRLVSSYAHQTLWGDLFSNALPEGCIYGKPV